MPQLTKGGKWVLGWCVVGPDGEIQIPPEACTEYGFQSGESVIITLGSQRSGRFGIGRREILSTAQVPLQSRSVGQTTIGAEGQVALSSKTGVRPGERLLVVRGSRVALGFLQRGLIYEEALKHPEIKTFHSIGKQ